MSVCKPYGSHGAGSSQTGPSRSIGQTEHSSSMDGASADAPPATTTLMCGCRRPAALYRSNTAANPTREFYKCANPARQARCNCFKETQGCFLWIWKDCLNKYCSDERARKEATHAEEIRKATDEWHAKECRIQDKLDDSLFELADATDEIDRRGLEIVRLKLENDRNQHKIKEQAAVIRIAACAMVAAIVYLAMFLV